MRTNKTIFFTLLFAFVNFVNAQNTWTGSVSTDWDNAGNWNTTGVTDRVPNSTDNVIIPNVSNDPVINVPGAVCNDLTIESSATLTSNNGSNKLTASGTVLLQSLGQISMTNGEIQAVDFTHQGVLTMLGGTLLIFGDYLSASSAQSNLSGGTIDLFGDWDGSLDTDFDPSSSHTVRFRGGAQDIKLYNAIPSTSYFHNVSIVSGGTKSARSDLDINGNLSISSGTLDMYASEDNTLDLEGDFTLASSGTFTAQGGSHNVAGAWDDANGTFQATEGTVTLSGGNSDITTGGSNYFFNLEINSTGTKTATSNLDINGVLTLTAGIFDAGSTSIDIVGDWDDSGNNGGFTPTAGTVTLSGAGSNITTGSDNNFFNLVINSSGAKSALSELDINGDLTVTDGELAMGANNADVVSGKTVTIASSKTLSMSSGVFTANGTSDINGTLSITTTGKYDADGDFDATGGTITFGGAGFLEMSGNTTNLGSSFTEGSGTVEYDGTSDQTIFNTTYNNLVIDQNSTKIASANLDVDGNLTIDNSATLDMSASNYNLTIDGNYTLTSGTFTSRTGTVTFNGAGAQSLTPGSSSFYNLSTATDNTDLTLQADITVTNDLTIAGNTTLDVGSNRGITLGGNFANSGTFTDQQGTVTFNGTGTLTSSTSELYNVTTSGTGTVTLGDALTIANDLTIGANTTLDVSGSNYAIGIKGDFANSGTFTERSGTVTFNGTGAQSITTGGVGTDNDFNNVTITNTGTPADGSDVETSDAIKVNGTLDVTDGQFMPATSSDFANVTLSSSDGKLKLASGSSVTVSGTWNNSGGSSSSFDGNSGTVTFDAAGAHTLTSGGISFYNLATATTNTDLTIQDALIVTNDLTVAGNTTLDAGSNQAISVAGNWSNSGTFTPASGTVTFNGSGAQTISGTNTFYDLTINNTHGSSKVSANGSTLTVQDDLLVSDGIFESASDYVDVTISAGATLELTGNITVSGDWSNSGTFTPSTNTVTFDGGVAQSLTSGGSSFYDLSTATASTNLTIQDALVVSNDLTIAASTTLDAGSDQAISVGGDWDNSGTFTSASNTVTFNGSGAQTVTTGGVGTGNDFNNVTITNSGAVDDASDVQTSGAIKVNGTLDVTDGQFMPAANSDFVNVTLSSSNGKLKQAGLGTITVSGTWNNSGGSSASFEGNFGTVAFDAGGAQSLTSGGISFYNLSTSTSSTDVTIQDALIVSNNLTLAASTTLDAGSNQAISVGRNWDNGNGGTFTSASGTVTFNGLFSQVITPGGVGVGNDFYNLTIANSGNPAGSNVSTFGVIKVTGTLDVSDGLFIPATSSEFLDVTVSTEGFLETAASSSITVSGNWSDAAGTFTPNTGTVVMDGTSKTIATGASNEFYNLTIGGTVTTSTSNDVEVEGTLTVSGSLIVSPGDELTLEDATVSGTLTVDADGSNNATLDFSEADNPVFAVTGTLNLDGEDASNRAIVSSDNDSRIDFDISSAGVLNADYFTMSYPTAAGFSINSSGTQVVSFGNFDGPDGASGVLLDLSGTGTISSPSSAGEITGCNFENTGAGGGTNGINVKSNSSTQLITFTSYGGTLASDATVGEANDDDGDNKLYFFNNEYYSSGSTNAPNAAASWFSLSNGTGISPSDFTNSSEKFIVQSGDTYTATGAWTVAGEVEVDGALVTGGNTITMAGKTDIDGTLTISNGGVYDANGEFDATGGTIDQDGTSALRMAGTVTSLGSSLDNAAGTVEYDGGAQDVFADDYFNLEIDQAGTKTAQGAVNVAGTLTVQSTGTPIYDIAATTTTVSGTSTISGTLNINGSGVYDGNGDFAATGAITMDGTARLQLSAAVSGVSNLGTLDDAAGTVVYDGGTQNILAGTYYNLEIDEAGTKTAQGAVTANGTLNVKSAATYDIAATTTTVTGNSIIPGTLDIDGSGVFDANGGTFNASTGNINFSGAGFLKIKGNASSFGTMNTDAGTVVYDKIGTQTVRNRNYYNLTIDGNGLHSLGNSNAINVLGDLVVNETGSTVFNMHAASVTVTGTTDIDGTLNITTGTINADGEFDATGGNVTFTDAGSLVLSNTVTDLGTFTKSTSTVTYDEADAQTIDNVTYNNLIIDQNATKTAANNLDIDGNLTLSNSATLSMSGSNYTLDLEGDFTITSGTFTAGSGNHDVAGNWDDSGTSGGFTPSAGTVTLSGDSKTITNHSGNNFFNLAVGAGTKTAENALDINGDLTITGGTLDMNASEDNTLDLEGDFSIASSGTFTAQGGIHNMAGNWDCSGGTFQSTNEGTVVLSGASKTITTGASNEFFNLTVNNSASTAGSNDVEVEGTLTVSGSLTVSPGNELTLEDATVSGTLTADADGSNSATIDFSDASSADFDVSGTLVLDGNDATNRAIVTSDDDSRIDVDITGTLTADYFTLEYPNITGLFVTGSNAQTISFGAFDYPLANGTLLNLTSATNITNDLITGCSFGNTSSVSGATNVTADGSTDVITFTVYSGALASDASTAEGNDVDASDKIIWFDNNYYSNTNTDPNTLSNWHTGTNGTGLNPSNFTTATDKFIVQSGDTYTANGTWSVAGEIQVIGTLDVNSRTVTMTGATDVDGTLIISSGTYNADGASDIAGTLSITGTGVYDADNTFTAASGAVTFTGAGFLKCDNTVTDLGTLSTGAGTVQYDGGAQDVFADDYYNLVIDQSGNKTAQGAINVANDMTISNSATYLTGGNTTDVNGATAISATLDINAGIFQADGSFTAASGIINFSGGGILKLENSPTSLGTLDNTAGKVSYKGGAINVLADNYYNLLIKNAGTKTALGTVNVAGNLTVGNTSGCEYAVGATTTTVTGTSDINGDLSISTGTYNALGATDIDGTLAITSTGVYDADNTFTAENGNVTFTGAGFLRCNNTVTNLGTLSTGAGTVQYDGGAQNVLADDYYNLVIDQSGNKTAQGDINVANDMTISNSATFVSQNTDVSGATIVSATLEIGNVNYRSRGGFSATGTIDFTNGGGKLYFYSVSPTSLGTLDNTQGTVVYMSGATDVLSDNYYTLTIDDGGTAKTLQGNANIAGNLNIKSSNELNLDNNTITVTGNSDLDGTLDFNSGGTFDANGTFDATNGTVQFTGSGGNLKLGGATVTSLGNTLTEGTGTIEYDYAGNQTVLTETYYNLIINNATGTKTSNGNIDADGSVTITAGIFDIGTGNDNLNIGGNFTNSSTFTTSGETITFDGSTENTSSLISDATVDLIINKSGTGGITFGGNSSFDNVTVTDGYLDIGPYTFTADNTISIASVGTLKIPNSGTFNADGQLTTAGEIDFTGSGSQGDLICSSTSANTFGTMDAAAGTVTFDGSSSQAIPVETFFNLKNSNTNGLTMSGSATVNGELNLNVAADITTGANTLTIGTGGSIANAADDRHINVDNTSGFLAKSTNSTSAFSFPVGNGTILRPIRLTPSSSSATTFSVRYDDNRYSDGSVTSAFSNTSGHISGYDGPDPANNAAGTGYYFDISRSGSANASLFIAWTARGQYGTAGNIANPNVTGITFGYYNGTDWDVISSSPTGSSDIGNVTSDASFNTIYNGTSGSRFFTLGSLDGENNLPIDLVSFEGECIDNQANLEFVVASQVNNDYFTIKRSKNILEWEEIGYINGGGTNNEEITYTWTDYSPKSGVNYYKLFQTDIDGISESFAPIAVTCESKVEDYHIYPNPTTNRIAVEFELEFYQGDDIKLVLRDFKGSIVKSNSIELNRGYNYFEVDLSDIPNGIYTVGYLGTKNHIPLKRVIKL